MYSAVAGFPEGSRSHRCDVRETAGGADRSQANGEGDGRGETGKLGRNLLAKCLTWREKWAVASVPGVVMSKDHMGRTALHAAALGGMFIPLCTHVCAPYTFVALFSSQKSSKPSTDRQPPYGGYRVDFFERPLGLEPGPHFLVCILSVSCYHILSHLHSRSTPMKNPAVYSRTS